MNSGKTPALRIGRECCKLLSRRWNEPIPDYDSEVKAEKAGWVAIQKDTQRRLDEAAKQNPSMTPKISEKRQEWNTIFAALNKEEPASGVLAPGVVTTIRLDLGATLDNGTSKKNAYIVGRFTYHDVFSGTPERTTKFCFQSVSGSTFEVCPESGWMD